MSQSPIEAVQLGPDSEYLRNWDQLGLLIGQGHSFSGRERNCCFLNTGLRRDRGGGRAAKDKDCPEFADVSAAANLDLPDDARGIVAADWDHDGDLDLWITTRTAPGIRFLRNELPRDADSVMLRLQGRTCNRDAIGARVEMEFDDRPQAFTETVRAGDSFVSQSSKRLHFGLGGSQNVSRVSVRWPGTNTAEQFAGVSAGGYFLLEQGSGQAVQVARDSGRASKLIPTKPLLPTPTDATRVVLSRRRKFPDLEFSDFEGQRKSLSNGDHLRLVNLWASWCVPCLGELQELKSRADQLRGRDLRIVALSTDAVGDVDNPGNVQNAIELTRKLGLPFDTGLADDQLLRQIQKLTTDAFYREKPLAVPSSFLIDRQGRVAVVYRGLVTPDQLLADIDLIQTDDAERIESAVFPLGGRSGIGFLASDPLIFAEAYYEGAYYGDARREIERFIQRQLADNNPKPLSHAIHMRLARAFHQLGRTEDAASNGKAAVAAYRRALEYAPQTLATRVSLAVVLRKQAAHDEAEMELEKAAKGAPDTLKAHRLLARTRMQLGQPNKAISHLKRALTASPNHEPAGLELAVALQRSGETDAAIEQYQQLLNKNPDLLPAANNLAWLYATNSNDQYRNAVEALRLAKHICGATQHRDAAYLDTLAAAQAESGDFAAAQRVIEQAIQIFSKAGKHQLEKQVRARAATYQQHRPHRE